MRVFSILRSSSNENKSYMKVDESGQGKVCMRVFSTLMSWSNENKRWMRIDKSRQVRVCMRVFSILSSRSNEKKSYMRVDENNLRKDRILKTLQVSKNYYQAHFNKSQVDIPTMYDCEVLMGNLPFNH